MAWDSMKTKTNNRRHPSLTIHLLKRSCNVTGRMGSSLTSPESSIRVKGGHLDRSFPDRLAMGYFMSMVAGVSGWD